MSRTNRSATAICVTVAGLGIAAAVGAGEQADVAATLAQAVRAIIRHDFDSGYTHFHSVAMHAEQGSETWAQAVFGQAVCAHQASPATRERVDEAARLYELLFSSSPDSKYAAPAMIALARLHELRDYSGDVADDDAARRLYQAVLDSWPDHEIAHEAMLRLADSHIRDFENESSVAMGIQMLEQWLVQHPDNPLAWVYCEYLGEVQMTRGNLALALSYLLRADELGLHAVRVGYMYWLMGQLGEEVGRMDVAIKYYRKLVIESPRGGRSYDAYLALQRIRRERPDLTFEIPEVQLFVPHGNPNASKSKSN